MVGSRFMCSWPVELVRGIPYSCIMLCIAFPFTRSPVSLFHYIPHMIPVAAQPVSCCLNTYIANVLLL